jgi:hypothetical protein
MKMFTYSEFDVGAKSDGWLNARNHSHKDHTHDPDPHYVGYVLSH